MDDDPGFVVNKLLLIVPKSANGFYSIHKKLSMNPLPTPSLQVFLRDYVSKEQEKEATDPLEAFKWFRNNWLVSGKERKLHQKLVGRSFRNACCWRRRSRQYPESILHLHGRQWQPAISTPVTILVLPGTRHPGPSTADWIRVKKKWAIWRLN